VAGLREDNHNYPETKTREGRENRAKILATTSTQRGCSSLSADTITSKRGRGLGRKKKAGGTCAEGSKEKNYHHPGKKLSSGRARQINYVGRGRPRPEYGNALIPETAKPKGDPLTACVERRVLLCCFFRKGAETRFCLRKKKKRCLLMLYRRGR